MYLFVFSLFGTPSVLLVFIVYIVVLVAVVCCCLGESGLGKSTLVNSLFLTDLYKDRKLLNAEGENVAVKTRVSMTTTTDSLCCLITMTTDS